METSHPPIPFDRHCLVALNSLSPLAVVCLGTVLAGAAPAMAADLCLQYSGIPLCPLSGSAGFFRFTAAKLPKNEKNAVDLRGRACGNGTVSGVAAFIDPTGVKITATYGCNGAEPGMIEATITGPTDIGATFGGRSGGDGFFSLNGSCIVTVVDCATEP